MIDVEYISVRAVEEPSYVPIIGFTLRIKNLGNGQATIWDSKDLVKINGQVVGYATTRGVPVVSPRSEKEISTILTVPYDVIERIEKSRSKEGKISLEIEYRPTIIYTWKKESDLNINKIVELLCHQFNQNKIKEYTYTLITSNSIQIWLNYPVIDPKTKSTTIRVTTDEWLDILSKINYKRCRVIEVPAIGENEEIKPILEELDKAWRLMAENYPESLNACRKALEELKKYMINLGFESNGEIDIKGLYGGGRFGDIMDSLFRNIWGLTDVGSHTGRSKMTTRADMEFIITSIYMLLKSMLEATQRIRITNF